MGSKTTKENAEAVPAYQETKNFMKQIEQFRLSKPEFYNQLIKVFNNDTSLTELNLYDNQIGVEGAQALATALQNNRQVTVYGLN